MELAEELTETDGPDWAARIYFAFSIVVGLLVLWGAGFVGYRLYQQATMTGEHLEALLVAEPGNVRVVRAFKRYYPKEFNALMADSAEAIRNGGDAKTLQQAVPLRMQAFVRSKRASVASASNATLVGLATANYDLARELRVQDTGLCARFGSTGLEADDKLSPPLANMLAATVELTFRAAREGEDRPVKRSAQMAPGDAMAFTAAMRRQGATDALFAQMSTQRGASLAYPSEQCDWTVALFGGAKSLPPEQGARVMAVILQNAGKDG